MFKFINYIITIYVLISFIYISTFIINYIKQTNFTLSYINHEKLDQETESTTNHVQYKQQITWKNDLIHNKYNSDDENMNHSIQEKSFSNGLGFEKINPYYYKAQSVINSSPHDVSITTLVTPNRLKTLMRLAHYYQGPISAVLHINKKDDQLNDIIHQLNQYYYHDNYDEQQQDDDVDDKDEKEIILSLKRFVDIHLLIDDYERQFNMWRNIARMYARTDYILMLDVDFLASPTLRQVILTLPPKIMDLVRQSHAALVIPAFEQLEEKNKNKKEKKRKIMKMKKKRISFFQSLKKN
ncbi:unnamed protein product [Cunninghamella blakesleeana]